MYKEMLLENGEQNPAKDYKKKLKELIEESILGAIFVKQTQKNKPELIITESIQSNAVTSFVKDKMVEEDFHVMWKIAKCLRAELLAQNWTFEGDVNTYIAPKLLNSFLKWVLIGPLTETTCDSRRQKMEVIVGKVTQLVSQNVKTNRQLNYKQKNKSYNKIETPLSIGTSLFIYHNTRSKKLVNFISDLNIGVTYDKVISIKKEIASSVQEQRNSNNGVFIPTGFLPGNPTFFAIDNGDVKIDTPDGKNQLHGTVIAAFQEMQSSAGDHLMVSEYSLIYVLSIQYVSKKY